VLRYSDRESLGENDCEEYWNRFRFFQQGKLDRARHGCGRRPLVDPAASGSLLRHKGGSTISILSWRRARTFSARVLKKFVDLGVMTRVPLPSTRTLRICVDQKRAVIFFRPIWR